jgi:hypothetical protein
MAISCILVDRTVHNGVVTIFLTMVVVNMHVAEMGM